MVGSQRALSQAMAIIERWYPVVSVLEELEASLQVMEKLLPDFCVGMHSAFAKTRPSRKSAKLNFVKPFLQHHVVVVVVAFLGNRSLKRESFVLRPEARARLEEQLKMEYELYHYLLQRLKRQQIALLV